MGGELTIIKITGKTLVGIDIGKTEHAVAIARENEVDKTFMIANTPTKRTEFLRQLSDIGSCSIAIEQIGGWATPLDQQLLSAGHQLVTIHPLRLARAREMYGQPHKDDKRDAEFLLWLLQELKQKVIPKPKTKKFQLVVPCKEELQKVKQLSRHYHSIVWSKTQASNQLTSLLLCYLPTLENIFKLFNSWSCLSLLSHAPCPSQWAKTHGNTMKAWLRHDYPGSKKNIGFGSTKIKKAKKYVWSGDWETLSEEVSLKIKHLAGRLLLLKKQQRITREKLIILLSKLPEGKALMSLPGCGPILATTILAELSPIERFKSHNEVAMYVGLTRVRYESGVKKSTRKVKLVNRRAKWAFRQLILLSRYHFLPSKKYIDKKLKEGKTERQARLSLGRQLVKVAVALIKTKKPFDPDRC